jgi:hypothetical protein
MLRILIADGTPAAMQAERETFGIPSNASLFEAARRCRRDLTAKQRAADRLLAIQQHLAGRRCPLAQDLRQIRRIMARGRKTPGPRHRLPALPTEHEH